jgi:tripartite-type tricarboxylate transporter receptor subunit TctC
MSRLLAFFIACAFAAAAAAQAYPSTPSAAIERLHAAMVKGLAKSDVRDKIALQGMDATPSASPAAFEAEVRKETPYWEKLVLDSGAKVE